MQRWFARHVLQRRWLAFVVLGLAFFVFGAATVNLLFMFDANITLIAEHGWQALAAGAALQLVELVVTGYAAMAAWIVFRACEDRLVHWLAAPPPPPPVETAPDEDCDPAR